RARRGAGRGGAAGVEGALAGGQQPREPRLDEAPAAVVLRLLLTPDELRRLPVGREDFAQRTLGERVELLQPHEGDAIVVRLLARRREVVEDLAAADDDAAHRRTILHLCVVDDGAETARRQLFD